MNAAVLCGATTRARDMTYCVGTLVSEGLVMLADTRTNAGLDNVSIFRKLHVYERPGERALLLATAGNLSLSQSVKSLLEEGVEDPTTGAIEKLMDAPTMFKAAQLVGRAVRSVRGQLGESLEAASVSFDVSFLFGGQIAGSPLRLFMIYAAGNFIECGPDAPFFQIGEHKYGKPILDRSVDFETSLDDALKLSLISMDSTMRSNIGVGLPVDLAIVRRDALGAAITHRIKTDDEYFQGLRESWSLALREAHMAIPAPPYAKTRR